MSKSRDAKSSFEPREGLLRNAEIPPRYWSADLPSVGEYPPIDEYVANLKQTLIDGRGLLLTGREGVGKTYVASAIARQALKVTPRVYFRTAASIVKGIGAREEYDDEVTLEDALRNRVLLIIDDLGREHRKPGSDFAPQVIDEIVRFRVGYLRSTIITTNRDLKDLAAIYSESFVSLLHDLGRGVHIKGKDHRKAK